MTEGLGSHLLHPFSPPSFYGHPASTLRSTCWSPASAHAIPAPRMPTSLLASAILVHLPIHPSGCPGHWAGWFFFLLKVNVKLCNPYNTFYLALSYGQSYLPAGPLVPKSRIQILIMSNNQKSLNDWGLWDSFWTKLGLAVLGNVFHFSSL